MVYELRTYTLIPGKMPEYLKAAETIGRPARGNNYGVNHGYWTSEFGALNQIWHLWKYDSYEERTRLRNELQKNKDWTEKYIPIVRTCASCGSASRTLPSSRRDCAASVPIGQR